jgi:hypothetical protein
LEVENVRVFLLNRLWDFSHFPGAVFGVENGLRIVKGLLLMAFDVTLLLFALLFISFSAFAFNHAVDADCERVIKELVDELFGDSDLVYASIVELWIDLLLHNFCFKGFFDIDEIVLCLSFERKLGRDVHNSFQLNGESQILSNAFGEIFEFVGV